MTAKNALRVQQDLPRVPNGHNYCWAMHKDGQRCSLPKGHSGRHLDPYTPRREW